MALNIQEISALHEDAERSAEAAGLVYVYGNEPGLTRVRHGKGFSYQDDHRQALTDVDVKARIVELAIPPAWTGVWISPSPEGHILATGADERGRKQYIYHPAWRTLRDMLNFYRLITFAADLPKIRAHTETQLRRRKLDRERVLAAMIRLIDLSSIRIGNEVYAQENNSFGLTTLTRKHISVSGDAITMAFPAKSGKAWDVTVIDRGVARVVTHLLRGRGRRLFTVDGHPLDADDVNETLLRITGEHITAKNFRTWAGTLAAFTYLRDRQDSRRPAPKVAIEAVDEAAESLGNTRTVARAHYVHPHVLETYTEHTFSDYLQRAKPRRTPGLDPEERALTAFLTVLFDTESSQLHSGDRRLS